MNPKVPKTDSIEELASFWDAHDLTDFEDQLEEVTPPAFQRKIATFFGVASRLNPGPLGGCGRK